MKSSNKDKFIQSWHNAFPNKKRERYTHRNNSFNYLIGIVIIKAVPIYS